FMADRWPDLIRVLPETVSARLTYWLVTRAETLRRPEVSAVVEAVRRQVADQQDLLLGAP
ncbi:MAG: LysR family transcriptional regulator, partial [Mycobacterium sp.]